MWLTLPVVLRLPVQLVLARRATTFGKVEQTNNPSAGLQGVALILFKFCLISEAQPHSSNTTSHPIP